MNMIKPFGESIYIAAHDLGARGSEMPVEGGMMDDASVGGCETLMYGGK